MAARDSNLVLNTRWSSSAELLRSGIFADAKIQLGESGRIWNVHTTIVCVQSKYLEAAFVGKYSTKMVKLDKDPLDAKSVNALLIFLYSGSLDIQKYLPDDQADPLIALMKIWVVADYLQVAKLSNLVLEALEAQIEALGRVLCMALKTLGDQRQVDHGADLQVMAAIERFDFYDSIGNTRVVSTFRPGLLRLALCGRHKLPVKSLCDDHPALVKGWESLLSHNKDVCPTGFICLGRNERCSKCQQCLEYLSNPMMLDVVQWTMNKFMIKWLCGKCYTVPTLQDWEAPKELIKLDQEQEAFAFDMLHRRDAILTRFLQSRKT